MSLSTLPKELRLQIYSLAYFSQSPRLVALRTAPHDESHDESKFCPRYSPSPAPLVANICHEARAEAYFQAEKSRHLTQHHVGLIEAPEGFGEAYFFRFEKDVLYLPLDDAHVRHFDDSPDNGFLEHLRIAVEDTRLLRNIAITDVINNGYYDGSLSNVLRHFPNISHMTMMVPEDARGAPNPEEQFVYAAHRIWMMYHMDQKQMTENDIQGDFIDVDFATLEKGQLKVISKQEWGGWSDLGSEWMESNEPELAFSTD
jgi:hypothetical protein